MPIQNVILKCRPFVKLTKDQQMAKRSSFVGIESFGGLNNDELHITLCF